MMPLREWQQEAIVKIIEHWEDRPLVWAVMGSGKSVAIAEVVRLHQYDYDIVVTVPTQSLVRQLAATIEVHTGKMCGRWYADSKTTATCTVVCHDSLATFEREQVFAKPYIWIADEAHKSECETVKSWVAKFQPARRVAFSATPWRNSERQTVSLFDRLAYQYTASDAYRDGHVVMPRVVHPESGGTVNEVSWDWVHEQSGPGVCNAVDVEDAEAFGASLDMPTMVVHYKSQHNADDARAFLSLGGQRCVVYVDMLSEGFDCPAIRWMCMRRPVQSRVRFAQEVGRGLRADTGKTECLIFDPFDLFGQLSMTFEAALGEIEQEEKTVVPTLKLTQLFLPEVARANEVWNPDVEAVGAVRSYLRATRVQLQMEGLAEASGSPSWRYDPCSSKQREMVDALMGRMDPDAMGVHATCIEAAWFAMHEGRLKKGDVSDLIAICKNWRKLK